MDRRIDRHPVTVADILCESTNQVAALAGVQLGRQSQLILPRYLGVLTLLRCLGRVPQRRSVLRPLRAFRPDAIGSASCRDRVFQYVYISVGAGSLKKKK